MASFGDAQVTINLTAGPVLVALADLFAAIRPMIECPNADVGPCTGGDCPVCDVSDPKRTALTRAAVKLADLLPKVLEVETRVAGQEANR